MRLSDYLDPSKVFKVNSQVNNVDTSESPYYSVGGETLFIDTSLGEIVVVLPKDPVGGMFVHVVDAKPNFNIAPCIVDGNGNNVVGSTNRFYCRVRTVTYTFRFDDGKNNWTLSASVGNAAYLGLFEYNGADISPTLNGATKTRNIVPLKTNEGSLGTSAKRWGNLFSSKANISVLTAPQSNINEVILSPRNNIDNNGGTIEFHYNQKSAVTSRIIESAEGSLRVDANVTAKKIFTAVWNDYAEYFPRGEETEPGDLIMLDLSSTEEKYVKAVEGSTTIVGVHSDTYGQIIGGEEIPDGEDQEEFNLKNFIPVGLTGRCLVKFTGKSKKGSHVVPSSTPGVARLYDPLKDDVNSIIGMLVEEDKKHKQRRLKVKLR